MNEVFKNLDLSVLTEALWRVIPALVCITFHELSHGYVAYRLGDPTAKSLGRLTLNPIKHIDVFGLLMMVVFKFGWAKPVPVNMMNFKNPKRGMAVTALAGPASNILLAAVFLLFFGLASALAASGAVWERALDLIYRTAYLSVALAVFNILPVPPLDGSKILFSFLPDAAYGKLMRYERFGFILLLLIVSTSAFSLPVRSGTDWIFDKLLYITGGVYSLLTL
jgi:Zn-dependent protease